MDNTLYLLSNGLTTGITEWIKQNTYFQNTFKGIFNYCRIDIPQGELPAVSVYLMPSNTRQPTKEIGKVKIAVSFNLQAQRPERAVDFYKVLNMLRSQFITNPTYLQQYLSKNWTPGLQFIQSINDIDFGAVEASLLKKDGSTTIPIILDYQIDIFLNQRALWQAGNDYFSPATEIYHTVEGIDTVIETEEYKK